MGSDKFGFHDTFITWINSILHSSCLSVLINGSPHRFFFSFFKRGSSRTSTVTYSVFLSEQFFSRGLSHHYLQGFIKLISAPRGRIAPSHVLYADDIFIFPQAHAISLHNLKASFSQIYSSISGRQVNEDKSHFYLSTLSQHL